MGRSVGVTKTGQGEWKEPSRVGRLNVKLVYDYRAFSTKTVKRHRQVRLVSIVTVGKWLGSCEPISADFRSPWRLTAKAPGDWVYTGQSRASCLSLLATCR